MKKILLSIILLAFWGVSGYAAIGLTGNIQSASQANGDSTDFTITKPTGTVDGDFMFAVITSDERTTITPPSGWTQLSNSTFGYTQYEIWTFYKRASSEGASYTWVKSSSYYSRGFIWRLTGVISSGDPLDSTVGTNGSNDGSTTISNTGITTGTANSVVIQIGATAMNTSYDGLSATTLTERFDDPTTTFMFMAADLQASAGASGTKSGTLATARPWGTHLLSFKEETGGGGSPVVHRMMLMGVN